jgi:hypothetical protein
MLYEKENVIREYAMDCGFVFKKREGLFNKIAMNR